MFVAGPEFVVQYGWLLQVFISVLSTYMVPYYRGGERNSIGTGEECRGATFFSQGKMPRIYLSIGEVPSKMSSLKFSDFPNHTLTLKSQMCTNIKMVSPKKMNFCAIEQA